MACSNLLKHKCMLTSRNLFFPCFHLRLPCGGKRLHDTIDQSLRMCVCNGFRKFKTSLGVTFPTFDDCFVFVFVFFTIIDDRELCHFCWRFLIFWLGVHHGIGCATGDFGHTHSVGRRFELPFYIQSECVSSLRDMCTYMMSVAIETSSREAFQADINTKWLVL